ncbi:MULTISPECIES: sigma-E factor negative regulatory protein [unclassified Comamonas]|uniref:sigma-E factor negative regulatory protein n=1 Tax=unclassified Comamonas TaxID=2638500 RepID=UPI00177ED2AB|nr:MULTISPECIES: sigma-E factor negative regulatory protein [unclassified Comamonas]MBD9401530.1 sigma-E factor negative regulatory protein [Comamonas sp. CMM02]
MMKQQMNKELLSALVDGELHGEELEQALACAEGPEGCASWELYHLVGDVLRSPDLAHHSQHDLLSGLRAQLANEPALMLEPAQIKQVTAGLVPANGPVVALRDPAANGAVFRWKVAASFASVAAVAALGWNLMGNPASGQGAQMASVQGAVSSPVLVATESGDVLRDPRLDALLDSHQQYLSRASLQTPADFLRNASFQARSSGGARP